MNSLPQSIVHCQRIMTGSADTVIVNLDLDMELLSEQKQLLLEAIWGLDKQDKRFKLWGIVDMIDHIQDIHDRV